VRLLVRRIDEFAKYVSARLETYAAISRSDGDQYHG
jgi:hypothetical protein